MSSGNLRFRGETVGHFSPKGYGVEFSCIQFLAAGVAAGMLSLFLEKPDIGGFVNGIFPLAYAGILSCGVAYTLQVLGQKGTDPAMASLILSLESTVSALAGWGVLGQALTGRELAGCALVFCAVILVQLPGKCLARHPGRREALAGSCKAE